MLLRSFTYVQMKNTLCPCVCPQACSLQKKAALKHIWRNGFLQARDQTSLILKYPTPFSHKYQ